MQALARAVVIIIVLSILGGIALTYGLDILAVRQADALARRSSTYAAGDPVGDALAVRAYGTYATPNAIAALRARFYGLHGGRQAYVPILLGHGADAFASRAAIFNHETQLAIAGPNAALDIFDAHTLAFVRRETLARPARFVCGSTRETEPVIADAIGVHTGTLTVTLPGITALACTTDGTITVAAAGSIWVIDPVTRRSASLLPSAGKAARRRFGYPRLPLTASASGMLTISATGAPRATDPNAWLEALCLRMGVRTHEPACAPYASEIAPL